MTADIRLHCSRCCPTCHGRGTINNPVWLRYELAREMWRDAHPRHASELIGEYQRRERTDFEEPFWADEGAGPWAPPPVELSCPDCAGKGRLELELPIDSLLRMVDAARRVA